MKEIQRLNAIKLSKRLSVVLDQLAESSVGKDYDESQLLEKTNLYTDPLKDDQNLDVPL